MSHIHILYSYILYILYSFLYSSYSYLRTPWWRYSFDNRSDRDSGNCRRRCDTDRRHTDVDLVYIRRYLNNQFHNRFQNVKTDSTRVRVDRKEQGSMEGEVRWEGLGPPRGNVLNFQVKSIGLYAWFLLWKTTCGQKPGLGGLNRPSWWGAEDVKRTHGGLENLTGISTTPILHPGYYNSRKRDIPVCKGSTCTTR